MNYLLDTNILLIYSRGKDMADRIESDYRLFDGVNNLGVSIVSLGEMDSLAKQLRYGHKWKDSFDLLLKKLFIIDINISELIDSYGNIDAFSQGKLDNPKLKVSSRNMGKNDLWIAATASVFDMTLITTDKDFGHLDSEFLKLKYVDIRKYK